MKLYGKEEVTKKAVNMLSEAYHFKILKHENKNYKEILMQYRMFRKAQLEFRNIFREFNQIELDEETVQTSQQNNQIQMILENIGRMMENINTKKLKIKADIKETIKLLKQRRNQNPILRKKTRLMSMQHRDSRKESFGLIKQVKVEEVDNHTDYSDPALEDPDLLNRRYTAAFG